MNTIFSHPSTPTSRHYFENTGCFISFTFLNIQKHMTMLCDKTGNYSGPLQSLHFHTDVTACPSSTVRLSVNCVSQQYLSVQMNKLINSQ